MAHVAAPVGTAGKEARRTAWAATFTPWSQLNYLVVALARGGPGRLGIRVGQDITERHFDRGA